MRTWVALWEPPTLLHSPKPTLVQFPSRIMAPTKQDAVNGGIIPSAFKLEAIDFSAAQLSANHLVRFSSVATASAGGTRSSVVGKSAPTPKASCNARMVCVAAAFAGMKGTRPALCENRGKLQAAKGAAIAARRTMIRTLILSMLRPKPGQQDLRICSSKASPCGASCAASSLSLACRLLQHPSLLRPQYRSLPKKFGNERSRTGVRVSAAKTAMKTVIAALTPM
mmetsp:Transcript_82661/g.145861  ORF Transcript_82661/g.145861 Transcript_82661/m.145861 type:complete len:225 (-) Transcript_82661:1458-2132(-)